MNQDDTQIIERAIATLWQFSCSPQHWPLIKNSISELLDQHGNHVLTGGIPHPAVNAVDGRGDSVESSALSEVDDRLISEYENNATAPNPSNDQQCLIDKRGAQGAKQLATTDGKCNTALSVPEVAGDHTTVVLKLDGSSINMEGAEVAGAEIVESVEENAEAMQTAETDSAKTAQNAETETTQNAETETTQNAETETTQNTETENAKTAETDSAETAQNAKTENAKTAETDSAKTIESIGTVENTKPRESIGTVENAKPRENTEPRQNALTESAETESAETESAMRNAEMKMAETVQSIGTVENTETKNAQTSTVQHTETKNAQTESAVQNTETENAQTSAQTSAMQNTEAKNAQTESAVQNTETETIEMEGIGQSPANAALLLDLKMKDMGATFPETIRARLSPNKDFERDGYCRIRIADFPVTPQLDALKKPQDSQVEEVEYTSGADTPEGFLQLSTHHGARKVGVKISPDHPVSETPEVGFRCIFGTSRKAKYYVGPPLMDSDCNSLLQCGPALAALQPLAGVNSVYWMLGEAGSATGIHVEDAWLHSVNIVWTGAKDWLILSPTDKPRLETLIQKHFPEQTSCSQAMRHLNLLASPAVLEEAGIPFKIERCIRGEGIITAPKACHQVINPTYCFATAINLHLRPVFEHPPDYTYCTGACRQPFFIAKDQFRLPVARRATSGKSRHTKPVLQPRRDLSPECHQLIVQNKYKPLMDMKVADPFKRARVLQLALQCFSQDVNVQSYARVTIDRPLKGLLQKMVKLHGKKRDFTLDERQIMIEIYRQVVTRETTMRLETEKTRDVRRRMTRSEREMTTTPDHRRKARTRALCELIDSREEKLIRQLSAIVAQGEVLAIIEDRLGKDFLRRLPFTTIESEFLCLPWPDSELNEDIHPTE